MSRSVAQRVEELGELASDLIRDARNLRRVADDLVSDLKGLSWEKAMEHPRNIAAAHRYANYTQGTLGPDS